MALVLWLCFFANAHNCTKVFVAYVYTNKCVRYVPMFMCTCACACACACAWACASASASASACACACVCVYVNVCACVRMCYYTFVLSVSARTYVRVFGFSINQLEDLRLEDLHPLDPST